MTSRRHLPSSIVNNGSGLCVEIKAFVCPCSCMCARVRGISVKCALCCALYCVCFIEPKHLVCALLFKTALCCAPLVHARTCYLILVNKSIGCLQVTS